MCTEDINQISLITKGATSVADTVRQIIYENPTKKGEYALDEKVKNKILNDNSISLDDRLTMCYGYSKIKRKFKNRKDILDLAEKYFGKGNENFTKALDQIDEDWFDFFMDKAENTSDDRFKTLWAALLSAQLKSIEHHDNLTISKKLISNLCLLGREDVIAFYSICCMTFDSLNRELSKYPFIYVVECPRFLATCNVRRYNLASLANLGLIEYNGPTSSFVLPKQIPKLKYYDVV